MLPLLQNQTAWGFVSGRVSALEGQLLSPALYTTLLAQERVDDMVRQLQGLAIDTTLLPGLAWDNWAGTLETYYTQLMISLRANCPDPAVVDLFLLQGQYFNLRQALERRSEFPFPMVVFTEQQLQAVASGDFFTLPEPARSAANNARGGDKPGEQPLPLDLLIDITYLKHLRMLAEQTGAPVIIAYTEEWVQSRIIMLLARANRLGHAVEPYVRAARELGKIAEMAPALGAAHDLAAWPPLIGGRLGQLFADALEEPELRQIPVFEQKVAAHLMGVAQHGRMQVFGPERVFFYLASVSLELFNLKLIVSGRIKHVEVPVLRQEVRVANG